jgi:transposase InsO family protein
MHVNVTEHPTATWVVQQLREAFPFDPAPKHFVFDRDGIGSAEVVRAVKRIGMEPSPTAYRSPWQNGTAERRVGF